MVEKKQYAVYMRKGREITKDIVNGRRGVSITILYREKQGYELEAVKKVVY